jgi:glutathione synthase/RimK-type ligase-like ATP-grasp enzyme
LGIEPEERQILSDHVPETHLVRTENVETLAQGKQEFVFKPQHGFAGRGLLRSNAVGRRRLRGFATHGEGYVAQKWVPKPTMEIDGALLWTDLRVWAYRGKVFHLSGRASRRPDRLDLTPAGGWLPTYAYL